VIRKYLELGLNDDNGTGSAEMQFEDEDFIEGVMKAKAPAGENNAKPAAIGERASAAIEAPTNLFPDGSPFIEGMTKIPVRKLRWRAKALVENNAFAIKDKSILDLRCQNGQFMHAALQNGAKYVEGIERQQELVDMANENLSIYTNNADSAKYKIHKGSLLGVLRKVKPNTFDTIFCFGVMNKLINNTGLMQQIVRIQPSYLIIDVDVNKSSEAITELDIEGEESASSEDAQSGKNVNLPSKSAIELLLSTYKFKFDYVDWSKLGIVNWAGLEDYLDSKRLSIIASKL
jgi:2-polyprenyl-3-methyl-5-hydroxy-6-metoxy-1,4-benzoquinol methylase